ncbi:MAG: oligosaccharide flippase family protein [Planctomycetota bacterium]|nr:oligosaccharide flippase family protein [Planctomycetota bacterium]
MLKNIGSNWALNVVQILVFMVLTTYVVNTVEDMFGVWEAIVAAAGPLQLLILGVPMATVRGISRHLAKNEDEAASRVLGTSVSLTLLMGVVTVVIGALVFAGFDRLLLSSARWNLTSEQLIDARSAYWVFVANLAVGFCLRLPYAVYDAHHDFIPRNLIMAGGFVVKLGLTMALLSADASLTTLAWVQIIVALIEFVLAFGVSRRRHKRISFRPARLVRAQVTEILSFSVFALLLNMGAMLAFRIDALVIGARMAQDDVMIYALGNKIFDPLINLLLAIGMVVMPKATELAAKERTAEVRDVFLKWSKVAMTLVLMLGTYLVICGPEFLAWWIGDPYDTTSGTLLQILMVSFFVFLPVRGVALPVLMGLGRPRGPAFGLLGMGVLNLVLSLALVGPYGVVGVAIGTAIPNVLFASWFVQRACRELDVPAREYLSYVGLRPVLGVAPIGLLLWLAGSAVKLEGFVPLVLAGLGFVGLFVVAQVLYVWKGDRYFDLHETVMRRFAR